MRKEIEISPYGSLLVYKREYTIEDVRSIIEEKKLKGLRIFAQLKDDRIPNLDFLGKYTFLEGLDITSVDDSSFIFLNNLVNLKSLTINVIGRNTIDLSHQANLENLTIQWRKGKIIGLENCTTITSLCLIDYAENDFTPIASLSNLEDMRVKTASIKSCYGIKNLTKLKNVLLANCRQLSELNELEKLKNLVSLSFDMCPQVKNYNQIGYLLNLEYLQIANCKEVSSINFIERLSHLKRLSLLGNTNISDGNLMPAKKIKEVFYKHRQHYNAVVENKNYDALEKNNIEKIKTSFR